MESLSSYYRRERRKIVPKRKSDATQAVFYGRYSPRPDSKVGDSLKIQKAQATIYAGRTDIEIVEWYEDVAKSGKSMIDRPGLECAIAHACEAKIPLMVYSLSRMARSTRDALSISQQLQEAGAGLICLKEKTDTSTPTGKLFFTLLAAIAEFERELISERTRDARKFHKAQGKIMSKRLPYGFRHDPEDSTKMIKDEEEQENIKRIVELRNRGLTLGDIVAFMEQDGRKPRTTWYRSLINKICMANS